MPQPADDQGERRRADCNADSEAIPRGPGQNGFYIGAPPTAALGQARFRKSFPRSTRHVPRSFTAVVSGRRLSASLV